MTEFVKLQRAARDADTGYESPRESGMNFAAVLAETIGLHPDLELEVPTWDTEPSSVEEVAWRALHEVSDPEFPISLPDLGLVYDVSAEGSAVHVAISFTASACPCVEFIKWDIRDRLLLEDAIESVEVEVTWDPPWTADRISERGRRALRKAGVSV
jgi:metal-sulfur cluster biosynthetic enzyme